MRKGGERREEGGGRREERDPWQQTWWSGGGSGSGSGGMGLDFGRSWVEDPPVQAHSGSELARSRASRFGT